MNKETFQKIILNQQLNLKRSHELYKLGVDLMEFETPYHNTIDELLREIFNEEQIGWIDWFLYERESMSGEILKATRKTKDGEEEICYDIDSLWETVKEASTKKKKK